MAILSLRRGTLARPDRLKSAATWLLKHQHTDGGWGDAINDASTINSTALVVAALVDANEQEHSQAIQWGKEWLQQVGGFAAINDPRRATLSGPCRTAWAVVGLVPWPAIQPLLLEIVLLPKPIRNTVSTTFPAFLSLALLHDRYRPFGQPRHALRRAVERWGIRWLRRAQCSNGGFEESAFLTALIAFCLRGTKGDDIAFRAEQFVVAAQRADGSWSIDRDLENFDSALAVIAARACGREPHVSADRALTQWFIESQFQEVCFPTQARPGGWAWARPGGWPDLDDTSVALRALVRLGVPPSHPIIRRGIDFARWMQNRDGSWSTFVKNSRVPFDRPCPYITGHVLTALAECGLSAGDPTVVRALRYLRRVQRPDGSFEAIWFRNYAAGTASVLEALSLFRLSDTPTAQRAVQWILAQQQSAGGWGGTIRLAPTAEETAWCLIALMAATRLKHVETLHRGVRWLCDTQFSDGTWPPAAVGLYFSTLWYADSMLAIALPAQALGMFRLLASGGS